MPRRSRLLVLTLLAVGLGSVASGDAPPRMAITGAPILAPSEVLPVVDPFPITRIRIAEDHLADALKPYEASTLVRLPRSEFEARVRKAALAAAERRDPPHLVEAKYTAILTGGNLGGDAQWTLLNPQSKPAYFSLDPLKLAVRSPTWADGSEAILGTFGLGFPAAPGVWVPSGRQELKLKWSATGIGSSGDRQFELRVPPCSSAVLDLELPADRLSTTSSDVLLTGPSPSSSDPNSRRWRFRFGDRARLEFGIRGPGDASGAVLASLVAKYELAPGRLACTFEFDLRTSHGSVAEWSFAVPPGLTIADAVANDRSGWRVDPASRELRVALRQPASAGKVVIAATAALPARGQTAALPMPRPTNAIGGEERLELRVHPDLELERLDSADYRLLDSTTAPDGTRTTILIGALLPAGSTAIRQPPTVRVAGAEVEFLTTEALDWRIEAGRVHLAARVDVRVQRGPVFRLAFRTPPGYALDRIASTPEDAVSYSGTTPTGIEVEFARPLGTAQHAELRLEFRGPPLASQTSRVPFPQFAPLGATERDGWISFTGGAAWSLLPLPLPGAVEATDFDWPDGAPSNAVAAYFYRGREPDGELAVAPVRPAFSATLETRLDGANATTRIALKATAGQLAGVVLFEPGSRAAPRTWRLTDGSNAIASAVAVDLGGLPGLLPPMNGIAPLSMAGSHSATPAGTHWFIRFARPASGEIVLETAATMPRIGSTFEPFTVLGATAVQSKMNEVPAGIGAAEISRTWAFDGLHVITLPAESHTLVVLGGTIRSRGGSNLSIAMPPGAEVRAACVGGHWLDPGRCELTIRGEVGELRLPIPDGQNPVRFEIRYRLPTPSDAVRWVRSPEPRLPGEGHSIARWWALPSGVSTVWPLGVRTDAATSDLPALLGESLDRPAGELTVSRYSGEAIAIAPARWVDAAGAAVAALLVLLAWFGVRRANRAIGFVLFAALFAVGAAFWIGPPAWERAAFAPLVVALVGAAAIAASRGCRAASGVLPVVSIRSSRRAALAIALAIGSPWLALHAQPTTPRDFAYILAGPADDPTREVVIVPRATLDRLDAILKKPEPTAVLTSASYVGRVEEGFARVVASYVVYAFRDGETTIDLPLSEARLERAMVDGKPALPVVAKADLYTVTVAGRGRHEIEVRFAVPVATTGPEREVRFGVPEAPDSRIHFAAPTSARQLLVVGRQGDQKTTNEKDAVRLEAGLGAIRTVHLRWREGPGGTAKLGVREGCVWDVSETGHNLTACYQLRVDAGSVSTLRFDLPSDLEPVRVAVRSLDVILGQNVLRDWSIGKEASGSRPLRIDLNGPTDGRLLAVLECVPRGAPTRQPVLRFPRPVGMTRTDAIYGLRASGVIIESIGRTGAIDFAADALTRDFGAVPDLRLSPTVPVIAFSPRPGEAAELRPVLRGTIDAPTIAQDLTWNLGPKRAEGRGTIRWIAKEPLPMLEFNLAAAVAEVRGAEIAGWAQTEGRVQVWFRKPLKESSVEWFGSAPPQAAGTFAFDPPIPIPLNVRSANQIVRVRPATGWAVRVERDKGWTPVPTSVRGWAFQSETAPPPLRLQVFPPTSGTARGFALLEISGPDLVYRGTVEIPIAPNRPHHLVLRAGGLPTGANATLDVPPGTLVHETANGDGGREWSLDIPASMAAVFRAALAVRFAAKGTLPLPVLDLSVGGTLPNPAGVVKWLGLTGVKPDVRLEGVIRSGLSAIQSEWPGEADRMRRAGGSVWEASNDVPMIVFPSPPAIATKANMTPKSAPPPEATSTLPVSVSQLPVISALAWCGAVLGVMMLFVRSPRFTWPEQVGLLGAMFGIAVAGGIVAGIVVYSIARAAWLVRWIAGSRR